jgi:CheY-like chemotaxis protein
MSKKGPILLIEDDIEDQELTKEIISEVMKGHEVISFLTCDEALGYLLDDANPVQPFLILSDVNLPKMTGVALKEKMDQHDRLRKKSIPFVFYSTSARAEDIDMAYEHRVQGYFLKDSTVKGMKETLKLIYNYWSRCKHPNN